MGGKVKSDAEGADEQAMAGMDTAIEGVELEGGGALKRTIVEALLAVHREIPRPWADATKAQQQDVFRRFDDLADVILDQTTRLVAEAGVDRSVICIAGKMTVDTDLKVQMEVAPTSAEKRDAALLFLSHARGRRVLIRMASPEEFDTEEALDPSQDDQNALPLDQSSDEEPLKDPREGTGEAGQAVEPEVETAT